MMTRIYITRHGETEWNIQHRFQGMKNSELTEKGILAAELLSERMENIELDCIVSSPLKRAFHTAEIVRGNKEIEIIKNEGFKEINLGDFEGMNYDEISEASNDVIKKIRDDPFNNPYPNGENLMEFYKRVENAFKEVIEKYKEKCILIVAHGGTIKCIESYFRNQRISKDWMSGVVHNCSLTCIEVNEHNKIKEIFYNNIEHLKERLAYN
ncbi:MAG: histidine phosphatase family protein [Tissierellia bacterium]|nr:histidine phosphatase family protein [Tissierellia bacterium]